MEKILIDALKNIASTGKDGKCPGNCEAPRLAVEALVSYGNAKYKKAGVVLDFFEFAEDKEEDDRFSDK